jgi:NRPS condensation-like uncharacterized protein
MKKMSANPPKRIPLNAIDRSYLLPESDSAGSAFFPMCIVATGSFNIEPERAPVVDALRRVDAKYPQFRLAYRLDLAQLQWMRLAEADLSQHFDSLVQLSTVEGKAANCVSHIISTNNTPLEQPFTIWLHAQFIIIKMHHSFGDGKFLLKLLGLLMQAIGAPAAFAQGPALPAHYTLSTWRLIGQSPKQAAHVVGSALRWVTVGWKQTQRNTSKSQRPEGLEPIMSGTAMQVILKTIPPPTIALLNELRRGLPTTAHISLNTLLQVLLARRLADVGLVKPPITYSIPVDLHRYLKNPSAFYPGNLAHQIRITVSEPLDDLPLHCATLQTEINRQLDEAHPLVNLLSEWLFQRASRRIYERLNREWLLASMDTDPRFFVLTNLGTLDGDFEPCREAIDASKGVHLIVPLMGAPSLVVGFDTLMGQGNLSITYDSRVLTADQINDILVIFDEVALRPLLQPEVPVT